MPLPGVGRKTANLILGDVFKVPGSTVVDTHCIRISNRLGDLFVKTNSGLVLQVLINLIDNAISYKFEISKGYKGEPSNVVAIPIINPRSMALGAEGGGERTG